MTESKTSIFPKSRIATNDVCAVGIKKHHVVALLEVDVSESRKKIRIHKRNKETISFTAWLIKVIATTIKNNEEVASYLKGKRKRVIFNDINVSLVVEKEINGQNVPIPLLIEKANEKSIEFITARIKEAKDQTLTENDIVLQTKSNQLEHFYYYFPGFIRRWFWHYLIRHPKTAFSKMGNVAFTSLGMVGKANGWFIPISVHPVCFGIGNIIKKPVVHDDQIVIRETLNMTVLLDHDIVDGAQMARFISDLTKNIENALGL